MKRMYSTGDVSSVTMIDILLGFIGSGFLIGLVTLLTPAMNEGSNSLDLTKAVQGYVEELKQTGQIIATLEDEADQARQFAADANKKLQDASQKFATNYAELSTETSKTKLEVKQQKEFANIANSKLESIKKNRKTRMYFVVDDSASMAKGLRSVQGNAKMLARTMPVALTHFEMGVVAFHGNSVEEFGLKRVVAPTEDGGASLKDVNSFLDSLTPTSGVTSVDVALNRAMRALDQGSDEYGAEIIVVISDVGPGDLDGYSAIAGDQVIDRVSKWANKPNRRRRVIAIQTGRDIEGHTPFFEGLGSVNKESTFTTNLASMFPLVVEAAFVHQNNEEGS